MSFLASLLFSSLAVFGYLYNFSEVKKIEVHSFLEYNSLRDLRKFKKLLRNGSSEHLASFAWEVDWKHCKASASPVLLVKTLTVVPSEHFPRLSKFMTARLREHELEHKKNLLKALPRIERVLQTSCWLPKELVDKLIFKTLARVRRSDILLDILTNHGKKP